MARVAMREIREGEVPFAAGTAIRPDRRPVGYAAAVLFVLATWVRLAAWQVDMPEAYTIPVTVPAPLGTIDGSALDPTEDPHRYTVAAGLSLGAAA